MKTWVANKRDTSWLCEGPSPEAVEFHRGLPGYEPTALVDLPDLARELGVGHVLAKNEAGSSKVRQDVWAQRKDCDSARCASIRSASNC